ncbi:MAG: UDP-N-acetylglucosamine--N-acetylmuramyl-(pentapeptide) pyrophosphoryl-undecaprenol N-acetylglucosamine transferase [Candidatus Babeliaceae bacterium]|nr:UDP-N-acetylglucosamine--N-acetylmuramyl-(pentapeptide) pyrophosphoryl-undecaprenol N-acetylglucosamine transferase [Candidatus Babeliaceae bacterium]
MSFKKFLGVFLIAVFFSAVLVIAVGGVLAYRHMQQRFVDVAEGKTFNVCYVAGRSGGHIIPALTHARKSLAENPRARLLFISTDAPLDRSLVPSAPEVSLHECLALENVPYGSWRLWPGYFWRVFKSFCQTAHIFWRYRPLKVVSMGGYVSVPVVLLAWVLRIPIELYELNVIPGSAARFLSRFATATVTCFDETKKHLPPSSRVVRGRYPVRFKESDKIARAEARKRLGIASRERVLLVVGGSQGSHFFNTMVPGAVKELARQLSERITVLHQTGGGELELRRVRSAYGAAAVNAQVFTFSNNMQLLYAAADLVVARAGAGTIFEVVFFNRKVVLIPLETTVTDHQLDNALAMSHQLPKLITYLRQNNVERQPNLLVNELRRSLK